MASNEYHFITHWKVKATCTEVYNILSETESLSNWWPSVYLDVIEISKGDENSICKKVKLYTKGWLPYTLKWRLEVVENIRPSTISFVAYGDFSGRGIWVFKQNGEYCEISFDWKLSVEKYLLRSLSFILKPVFSANHTWAMKKGKKSLELELLRRRSNSPSELYRIAPPPGPTFPHNFTNNKIFRSFDKNNQPLKYIPRYKKSIRI